MPEHTQSYVNYEVGFCMWLGIFRSYNFFESESGISKMIENNKLGISHK